eukprot:scaffold18001_cov66-Skeletonema_marinoi.AAC.1
MELWQTQHHHCCSHHQMQLFERSAGLDIVVVDWQLIVHAAVALQEQRQRQHRKALPLSVSLSSWLSAGIRAYCGRLSTLKLDHKMMIMKVRFGSRQITRGHEN